MSSADIFQFVVIFAGTAFVCGMLFKAGQISAAFIYRDAERRRLVAMAEEVKKISEATMADFNKATESVQEVSKLARACNYVIFEVDGKAYRTAHGEQMVKEQGRA